MLCDVRWSGQNHEQSRNEYLSSEQQLQPLKEDNVRLLHENNALHLELIHEAEREDEQHQQLQIHADKLNTNNAQLAFLNSQYRQKAEAAEAVEVVERPARTAETDERPTEPSQEDPSEDTRAGIQESTAATLT